MLFGLIVLRFLNLKIIKNGKDHNGSYVVYKEPWNEFETLHYNDHVNEKTDKFFFKFDDAKTYAIELLKHKLNNLTFKLKTIENLTENMIHVLH